VQPAVLQWFISHIETFAPAAQREERQQCDATIRALQSSPSTTLYGSEYERSAYCQWVTKKHVIWCKDPLMATMIARKEPVAPSPSY